MKFRGALAVGLAAGVTIGTPVWAIQDDGEESTTTVEVTEAPTTATDPPTTPATTEAPPSTNANPTTTITIPTSTASTSGTSPTSTGTDATPNTGGPTTPSQRTSSAATEQSPANAEAETEPRTEEEIIEAIVSILAAFVAEPQTVVPTTTTTMPSNKVFVCKYEGTPGIDERLQTGQNPISVAWQPGRSPGQFFNDAQGRSYSLAWDVGQDEPDPNECPPPNTGTTTTSSSTTTLPGSTTTSSSTTSSSTSSTTSSSTTTTSTTSTSTSTTSTTLVPTLFAIEVAPLCPDGTTPEIEITFGDRPDLDGQTGTLTFSTGGSMPLTFDSNGTTTIPYPTSAGTGPVTMTYVLGAESVTRETTFPEACEISTTTTTLVGTTTTSTSTSTTTPVTPTTTTSPTTSTTTATTFAFGAAASVCVAEVPTIRINFLNTFPELAGQTGTLTMSDVDGNVVSTQALVYQPGTTVDLLYPGTSVNADGSVADVPGWILNADGFWLRDPSDEFLREGINLTYTVNPTATAFVSYPPESSACANPDGPFPPGPPPPGVPPAPPTGVLPPTA